MAIKYSIVRYRNLFIDDHILYASIGVFHIWSLPDVTNDPSIVPFHQKFESTYSESMPRPKAIALLVKEPSVNTAGFPAIHVEVPQN
jgi:hypothetical protein